MEAWHFLPADRKLRYPPHTLVEAGQTLTVEVTPERPLALCEWGLHFSERALDAIKYAPCPVVCRVIPSGTILAPDGEDKGCASERTCLWVADASAVLHEFACWVAEQALLRAAERERERGPFPRSWAAIEAKRAWLRGEITTEQLAEARAQGWAAAWAAQEWAAQAWAAQADNIELERRLLALAPAPAASGKEA